MHVRNIYHILICIAASTLQTQYVAANVLRVDWENNDVTTENDVITGYDVWGGPKNCSRNIRSLDNKTQVSLVNYDIQFVDGHDLHICDQKIEVR